MSAAFSLSDAETPMPLEPNAPNTRIVEISSHLCSRVCHDLGNSVGAMVTGMGVLEDADSDPDFRDEALQIMKSGLAKSAAILELARLAFGSSGGMAGEMDMADASLKAADYYAHTKARLDWQVPGAMIEKWKARAMLSGLVALADTVPRAESTVVLRPDEAGFVLEARGPKVKAKPPLLAAFAGEEDQLSAKEMPAFLCALLVRLGGMTTAVDFVEDEHLIVRVG